MRETLNIKNFNTGLVTNIDSKDIPKDAGVSGTQNLDPNVNGKLQGAKTYSQAYASGYFGRQFGWIERSGGERDLIVANDGDTRFVTDFYGTTGASTDSSADSSKCVTISHEEAHIGCGISNDARWSGHIGHGQFSGSAPSGLRSSDASCDNITAVTTYASAPSNTVLVSELSATTGDGFFKVGNTYLWTLTAIYDGVQESPLPDFSDITATGAWAYGPVVTETTSVEVRIIIKDYAGISERISGFNLYRAEIVSGDIIAERTLWRHVKTIDINDASWGLGNASPASGWTPTPDSSDYCIPIDDVGDEGVTFEQNAGFAENIYTTDMRYTIGCEMSSYHFVGNCFHDNLTSEDGTHMIFRSQPYRYDTFDWTNDYIRLPFIPKAIAGYNGRIYAFDNNKIVRINPEGMFVEEEFEGAGCEEQRGLVVTEFGLFFANSQDCYVIEGTNVRILSDRIRDAWQAETADEDVISVSYDGQTNQVMFFIGDDSDVDTFGYHLPKKRWDYYSNIYQDTFYGSFSGKDGEVYTTDAIGGIVHYFGSATRKSWTHITPEFDFEDPSQLKKFVKVETDDSTATVTTTFGVDGAAPTTAIASMSNNQNKTIQIKMVGNATGIADSTALVFRRMRGKR